MAVITLTQPEIDALKAERTRLLASIPKRQLAIDAQVATIQAATDVDNAEKKVFNFYNNDVIIPYENERTELDGRYVDTPILLSELDAVGSLDSSSRLFPANPITIPTRIAQFDGTPLITTDNEIAGIVPDPAAPVQLNTEPYWIGKQKNREDWLKTGFGGTTPVIPIGTTILDAVTPSTLQITVTVPSPDVLNFAINNTFVIDDTVNQTGVLVTNVVSQAVVGLNFESVLDVLILVPLSLNAGAIIDETWAGFSNADRTNKIDATDGYTVMLTTLITDLEIVIDKRKLTLDAQKVALLANLESSLDPAALIEVDAALSVLTTWKLTDLVADADLLLLFNERATRNPQITTRINTINSIFTAPINFFNKRYDSAVNIADTGRGTVRIKLFRVSSQSTTAGLKVIEENRVLAIEDLLTLAGVPF